MPKSWTVRALRRGLDPSRIELAGGVGAGVDHPDLLLRHAVFAQRIGDGFVGEREAGDLIAQPGGDVADVARAVDLLGPVPACDLLAVPTRGTEGFGTDPSRDLASAYADLRREGGQSGGEVAMNPCGNRGSGRDVSFREHLTERVNAGQRVSM